MSEAQVVDTDWNPSTRQSQWNALHKYVQDQHRQKSLNQLRHELEEKYSSLLHRQVVHWFRRPNTTTNDPTKLHTSD
jgi:hypothetical protein